MENLVKIAYYKKEKKKREKEKSYSTRKKTLEIVENDSRTHACMPLELSYLIANTGEV